MNIWQSADATLLRTRGGELNALVAVAHVMALEFLLLIDAQKLCKGQTLTDCILVCRHDIHVHIIYPLADLHEHSLH